MSSLSLSERVQWAKHGESGYCLCMDCSIRAHHGLNAPACAGCFESWRQRNGSIEYLVQPVHGRAAFPQINNVIFQAGKFRQRQSEGCRMDQEVKEGMERELRSVSFDQNRDIDVSPMSGLPQMMGLFPGRLSELRTNLRSAFERVDRAAKKAEDVAERMASSMEAAANEIERQAQEHSVHRKELGI